MRERGIITGNRLLRRLAVCGLAALLTIAAIVLAGIVTTRLEVKPVSAASSVTITVDLGVQYQRFQGFGQASAYTLVYSGVSTLTGPLRAIANDKAYRQVGLNTGSIGELLESPGGYDQRQNDNSDPLTFNWSGFNTDALTASKQYEIDPGKPFGFTGYYLGGEAPNVRFGSSWMSPIRNQNYDLYLDEAAEQVVAMVTWWKNNYGEELPYFQLGNEQLTGNAVLGNSDGSGWGPVNPTQQMVDMTKRAGARLRAAGFLKTLFVVGTEETENASLQLATAIMADPAARQYVGAIGYHTYPYNQGYSSIDFILSTSGAGVPDASRVAVRNSIRDLAQKYNVGAWLMENSNGGSPSLSYSDFRGRAIHIHDEFLYANAVGYNVMSAMWDMTSQQMHFDNSDLYTASTEGLAVLVNNSTGAVDIAGIGYAIGHYAHWIKPGAVRVDAQSTDPLVQVTAFRDDSTGRVSLVLIDNESSPTAVTINLKNGAFTGSLTGEQSTSLAYWAPMAAFPPDSASAFHLVLPSTSVTSVAGTMSGWTPVIPQARIVPSGSYAAVPLAPDSIATMFTSGLAIPQGAPPAGPVQVLNATSVNIQDSAGAVQQAPLFFVSPNQINLQIPPGVAQGPAFFNVMGAAGMLASGAATISSISPSLFSANGDGAGVAAAQVLRVAADGSQTIQPIFQCGTAPGSCKSTPIAFNQGPVYLILYGTGIRNRVSLSDVVVTIGGVNAAVLYAGPQPQVPGMDQINVLAPALHNSGDMTVVLTLANIAANAVTVGVQ